MARLMGFLDGEPVWSDNDRLTEILGEYRFFVESSMMNEEEPWYRCDYCLKASSGGAECPYCGGSR